MNQFLQFEPILKDKIWGGDKLQKLLNKNSTRKDIGESWEISDVQGEISIVSRGDLKGKSLQEILTTYKGQFLGNRVYESFGNQFPLLIKFIDAKEALSIQLHPHDDLAKKRHNSFGKTEMWYVMQADEEANLIVGFNKDVTKEEYLKHLNEKTVIDILNIDRVKKGDVYFIPTGRVHAIGAGVLLAEIQQTSDITYRIYDWDRQDVHGNYRELHTEEALDAIDFTSQSSYKTEYSTKENQSSTIVKSPYFHTSILEIKGEIEKDISQLDSFVIYICVSGDIRFTNTNDSISIQMGQTILVPSSLSKYSISSKDGELLEVTIP